MNAKQIAYNENYLITTSGEVINSKTGRVLKPNDNGHGYLQIRMGSKNYYIHRLVAEAFIPNPDNLPEVDHIDTDKSNNSVENLRWVTRKENQNNPLTLAKKKRVAQFTKDGEFIKEYRCAKDAADELGINDKSINRVCHGDRKTYKKFIWKYVD